jgi:hypothetical protein
VTVRLDDRVTLGQVSDVTERAVSPPPTSGRKRRSPAMPPRNGGGRPKIDWADAFAFFVELGPTRSLGEVARNYPVSMAAVRQHAKAEKWEERVAALDNRLAAKREAKAERTLEAFQTEATDLGHVLLASLRASVKAGEVPKPSDFQGIVKTLQLLYGEATDRPVSRVELDGWVATLVKLTVERLPVEERKPWLDQLEAETQGLVAIEGGAA